MIKDDDSDGLSRPMTSKEMAELLKDKSKDDLAEVLCAYLDALLNESKEPG